MRGEQVVLIPADISEKGANKLIKELKKEKVNVIGKGNNLVVAKWDDNARFAVMKVLNLKTFHVDKIGLDEIKNLPETDARYAIFWNWLIDHEGKKIIFSQVKRIMTQLKLEVRSDLVYDKLTKKNIGKVERGEKEDNKGNWCLRQSRGWERFYTSFGYWEKLWVRSRTYASYSNGSCTGGYLNVAFINAELNGPKHHSYKIKYNAHDTYTEDWAWIWLGSKHCGTAYSSAYLNNPPATRITKDIC